LQQAFVKDIVARLESLGVPYAITGSIASNFWGTPRTTHDIDIAIELTLADLRAVMAAFDKTYYVSQAAVYDAIYQSEMFNVIDSANGIKADFWVSKGDPFAQSMMARRQRVDLIPGHSAFVGSAEDVLLHKLVWHTITPSTRQLGDAAGIAAVQGDALDLIYMREWAARQGTSELLEDVLQGKYLKKT
jgi:hypothetical protein